MKRLLPFATALMFAASAVAAPAVSVVPTFSSITPGTQFDVDIRVTGLGNGVAIGTFDLSLAFDETVLMLRDARFGDQLDLFGLGSIQSTSESAGSVSVFELSLDSEADLLSQQQSNIRLASLTFLAVSTGSTPLVLAVNALGDAAGSPLAASLFDGAVTVQAVPEPLAYVMFLSGFVCVLMVRRRTERVVRGFVNLSGIGSMLPQEMQS